MKTTTLAYASAFIFNSDFHCDFKFKQKLYQFIKVVYDIREVDFGTNTIVVAYDYRAQQYVALNASNEKIGNTKIIII